MKTYLSYIIVWCENYPLNEIEFLGLFESYEKAKNAINVWFDDGNESEDYNLTDYYDHVKGCIETFVDSSPTNIEEIIREEHKF